GLTAVAEDGLLAISWVGAGGAELRARFAVIDGRPVVADIFVRPQGGAGWSVLGENLKPEYYVVSGIRRFSSQQGEPLAGIGQLNAARAEKEKWYAYRDAPLLVNPPAARGGRGARGGGDGEGGDGGGAGGGGRASGPPFPYTSPKPEDI